MPGGSWWSLLAPAATAILPAFRWAPGETGSGSLSPAQKDREPPVKPAMAVVACMLLGLAACEQAVPGADRVADGDPERGRMLIMRIGCVACHAIPGIPGPHGNVGPPLEHFGSRSMIGGAVANQPGNLIRWVREAPALAPDTAMPSLPLDEAEARHVAAYLYRLR